MQHLVELFKKAGLELEILENLDGGGGGNTAYLDIRRRFSTNIRSEYFRLYPGKDNDIQVLSIDKDLAQAVLMIREPAGTRYIDVPKHDIASLKRHHPESWKAQALHNFKANNRLQHAELVERPTGWAFKFNTHGSKRHFLLGVDERQLFIATLSHGMSTVRDAHKWLKTSAVTVAEGRVPGRTIRQGEWFFCNVSDSTRRDINKMIREKKLIVRKDAPIGGARFKAHRASELVQIPGTKLEHGYAVRENAVYVRGRVRHPDHHTVKFGDWRLVIKNNEPGHGTATGTVRWVD